MKTPLINQLCVAGFSPFHGARSNAKANAQYNLAGRTHYVDDDTRRVPAEGRGE